MQPELEAGLRQGLQALNLELTDEQIGKLLAFLQLIIKWNQVYNLTAVRQPAEMLTHHLLDSLAVVPALRNRGKGELQNLLDVGSGAGLPGVVIAICCPGTQVDCVDAVAKKAAFIRQAAAELKQSNLRGVHSRVEKLGRTYEVVSSRAFASLKQFIACSSATLAEGGVWLAMKGKHPAAEIAALPQEVEVFHVEQLAVPGLEAERCIVWIRRRAA
jgi:16S rRNA (guanine527-N7)-methyltransferase